MDSIAIQSDDKVIVAGDANGTPDIAFGRYNIQASTSLDFSTTAINES